MQTMLRMVGFGVYVEVIAAVVMLPGTVVAALIVGIIAKFFGRKLHKLPIICI